MTVRRSVMIFRNHFREVEEMVRNKWTIESECADWRVLHMGIARVLIRNTDSLALTDSKSAFECRCPLGGFPASSVGAAVGSLFRVTGRKRTLTVVSCDDSTVSRRVSEQGRWVQVFSRKRSYRKRGRWSKGEKRDIPSGPVVKHLWICLPMQKTQAQSLVGEVRSHGTRSQRKKLILCRKEKDARGGEGGVVTEGGEKIVVFSYHAWPWGQGLASIICLWTSETLPHLHNDSWKENR